MNKINILSQETIDKIAAGEVVERPASVVKELLENSIDAHADSITVEIKGGGIEYIRITDNGIGIDKSQIPVAFLRHTTSKITDSKDLESIRSLGFRGEALSSISAVAKVELITKTKDSLLGSRYLIEGAKEISLTDIGAPDGTSFIIRQLFFNTPVRKKFLKAESTEASYIVDIVEHIALSHPEISFRLIVNNKEKLMTTGNKSLLDTIYQIYGKQIASNVLAIEYEDTSIKINGFIGNSILARGNRVFENFYINNRYIKSKSLAKAVEEGYYGFLMGHQYPFFLLNIDFLDNVVDVNVHPTKQEVRFENEAEICELLTKIVNSRLTKREDILDSPIDEEKVIPPVFIEKESYDFEKRIEKNLEAANTQIKKTAEPFEQNRLSQIKSIINEQIDNDEAYNIAKQNNSIPDTSSNILSNNEFETDIDEKIPKQNMDNSSIKPATTETYEQLSFLDKEAIKEHKIIGQVFNTYWIIEYDKKMYVIDQHAAHEKVLFEKTMKKIKENTMTSQLVCPPVVISLSSQDKLVFSQYKAAFEKLGYEIEDFGGNEIALKGIPGNLLNLDPKALFLEILADISTYKASNSFEAITEKVASMSCKAAVKGNNKLSESEIKALINDLLECDNPYHCPHGRPTMISFTEYELGKKFKRIL